MKRFFLMLMLLSVSGFCREIVNEGFEVSTWGDSSGWIKNGMEISGTNFYAGSYALKFNAVSDYIISPQLDLKLIRCWFLPTNSSVKIRVSFSSNGGDFSSFTPQEFTGQEDVFSELTIAVPQSATFFKLTKVGVGNIYIDNMTVDNGRSTVESVKLNAYPLKYTSKRNVIYKAKIENLYGADNVLQALSFITGGNYSSADLPVVAFRLWLSSDALLSNDDTVLGMANRVSSAGLVDFSGLSLSLPSGFKKFILISVDLAEEQGSSGSKKQIGATSVTVTLADHSNFDLLLNDGGLFEMVSLFHVLKRFENGLLSDDKEWFGDLASFALTVPPQSGAGSVNYTGRALASDALGGERVAALASSMAFGEWAFWVADGMGWDLSSQNNFAFILTSDTVVVEKMRDSSKDYRGYFLRYDGTFKLCRQDGIQEVVLADSGFPENGDSAAKNSGYSVKVKRFENGHWRVYIDSGTGEPVTERITVGDDTYRQSTAVAFTGKVKHPSESRRFYLDDVMLKESFDTHVVTASYETLFYKEEKEESTVLSWSVSSDHSIDKFSVWYLKGSSWIHCHTAAGGGDDYYFEANVLADDWMLKVHLHGEVDPVLARVIDKHQINCTLIIEKGWNLIGLSNRRELLAKIRAQGFKRFWIWEDGYYQFTNQVDELSAFWLYSTERVVIDFVTLEQRFYEPDFQIGWNMISFNSVPDYELPVSDIFSYYAGEYDSCQCAKISLFNGYWLFYTN